MFSSVTVLSHAVAALLYVLVAVLLIVTKAQHKYKALLITACFLTAAWSAAVALQPFDILDLTTARLLMVVLEQVRSIGWIVVLGYTLFVAYRKEVDPAIAVIYVTVLAFSIIYVIWQTVWGTSSLTGFGGTQSAAFASILVATCGLAIVENLFRNAGREARWALKYLCFAVGGIFGYDLVLQTRFALFGSFSAEIYAARGIVDAMMTPLIAVAAARSRHWPIDLHVSRRIVFHSATILVAGIYLLGMSAIGFYLRILESPWGSVARVSFIAIGIVGLVAALSSSSVHARIRNFITKNFFSYRYDYREEWLNFIESVSGNLVTASIPERIVRALANLLDCTAGAIWTYVEEDNSYRRSASWNMDDLPPNVSAHEPLPALLAAMQGVIDIKNNQVNGAALSGHNLPAWLAEHPRTWLVVPLSHAAALRGFVVLGRPRAERVLNWEDFELLKTAGRQAASYIAEDQAATSLIKARRFEDFNRQFAFVVHDIKNLAGQMSLILKNAERHGEDPRFQKDVLATVADSLTRMQSLLDQLKQRRTANAPIGRVDLVALLERRAETWRLQMPSLRTDMISGGVEVVADSQRLEAIFNHLVQNAAEASGPGGQVELKMGLDTPISGEESLTRAGWVTVEVVDNGPGMDQAFIGEKLFQPLSSTKSSGFGIGAYQAISLVREMGGNIDVKSQIGVGTRMIVRLPVAAVVSSVPPERRAFAPKLA